MESDKKPCICGLESNSASVEVDEALVASGLEEGLDIVIVDLKVSRAESDGLAIIEISHFEKPDVRVTYAVEG